MPLLKSASNFLFRYALKCMHITCLLWTKANKTWTLAQARAKPNLARSLLHPATIQYSGLFPLHCLFLGGFFFFFFSPEHAKSNASDGTWGTAVPLQLIAQLTDYPQIVKVIGSAPSEMGTCVHVHPTLGSKSLRGTSSSYFSSYQEQYKLIKTIITEAAWIYNCQTVPLTWQSICHLSK